MGIDLDYFGLKSVMQVVHYYLELGAVLITNFIHWHRLILSSSQMFYVNGSHG